MKLTLSALVATLALLTGLVTVPVQAAPSGGPSAGTSAGTSAGCRRTLPAYPQLTPGTRSRAVKALQCVINDTTLGPVAVDGFYGPQTQAAIKKLTDTFEGPIPHPLVVRTWYWTMLFAASHRLRGLEQGDRGVRVRTLQRALRADHETLVIDGQYGQQTTAQVKVFQGKCNVRKTGRIDDRTAFFLGMGGCQVGS